MPRRSAVSPAPILAPERVIQSDLNQAVVMYGYPWIYISPETSQVLLELGRKGLERGARFVAQQWATGQRLYGEHVERVERERYILQCVGTDSSENDLARSVETGRQEIEQLRRQFMNAVRTTRQAELRLEKASRAERERIFSRDYDTLRSLDKVRSVRVYADKVVLFTEKLYCVDAETERRHEIGRFRIDLLFNGGVRWFNLDRLVHNMNAPHVYENGIACLGNTKEIFPELIASGEFAAAAMLAIQFVESANKDDPLGRLVCLWPRA